MAGEDLEDKFMLEAHLVKTTLCNPQQMRVIETAHPTLMRLAEYENNCHFISP